MAASGVRAGDTVLYRTHQGEEVPAVVTKLAGQGEAWLTVFAPMLTYAAGLVRHSTEPEPDTWTERTEDPAWHPTA